MTDQGKKITTNFSFILASSLSIILFGFNDYFIYYNIIILLICIYNLLKITINIKTLNIDNNLYKRFSIILFIFVLFTIIISVIFTKKQIDANGNTYIISNGFIYYLMISLIILVLFFILIKKYCYYIKEGS